ncbi:hypothetical protein KP803_10645 [Vibrio sp. ZSDE26]|uniref:Secreted protein n=1 Tax=Vibrio amylolyticus TaxID=2847292 RepID=A0A9X1XJ49_9VIBR|nr:hypothetical protein [Vibrio amylolyticus]MCK6263731.1 hypothetical protein [Vibrio amylolyticus]
MKSLVCLSAIFGLATFQANASAGFESENIYLAVSLVDNYEQSMLYDTDNIEDIVCSDVELARAEGIESRCSKIARVMIENNILRLGKKVRKDLKRCTERVKSQQGDIALFQNPNHGMSLYVDLLDIADVINIDERLFSDIRYYLNIHKLESGDQAEIDQINTLIDLHLNNVYIDETMRIKDINSLNCLNLQVTKFSRRASDMDTYEKYVTNTCRTVERLQQCHQDLYHTTNKLRNVVDDVRRYNDIEKKKEYLHLPRIKAVGQ